MRQSLARQLGSFRVWPDDRLKFLETYDWIFENYPLHRRVQQRYLRWIGYFARGIASVHGA